MKRRGSSWVVRVGVALLAALLAAACVSGAAEPTDGAGNAGSSGAGAATAGATSNAFAASSSGGAAPSGAAGTLANGGNAAGGSASQQAGSTSLGGSGATTAGGNAAGGSKPIESCNFPNWAAGHDYAKGDKVLYMGKAFVASEANPGYDPLISTYFWAPYSCDPVSAGGAGSGVGGSGGSGGTGMVINNGDCVLDKLLPGGETSYHALFVPPWQGHQERALYGYAALCTALKGFGQFASSGNAEADKRELAAFFAHVAKETAFLEQTDEAGQPSNAGDFHGRGAIQLTGQANYQAAGDYLNKNLVGNPGLVSTDAVTNWQTALWFWVVHNNPGTAGTKNCHQAIQAGDFAQTTRIINGGIECPGSDSAKSRAEYYKKNCGVLGVSPGSLLVC